MAFEALVTPQALLAQDPTWHEGENPPNVHELKVRGFKDPVLQRAQGGFHLYERRDAESYDLQTVDPPLYGM